MRKHRRCIHHPLRGDPPMLPDVTLPASLAALLGALRPCFTAPSYRTFCGLAAGLAAPAPRPPAAGARRRAPAAPARPHPPPPPPLARPRAAVAVAGGPCLCAPGRRGGARGGGGGPPGPPPRRNSLSSGPCFVPAGLVVPLPFCTRPVCLPVLARLVLPGKKARPAGRGRKAAAAPGTKVPVAVALVTQLAAAFPRRTVHVVADAAYHGPALTQLPASVTWTTRLPANAVLYALAPPRLPGERGRPCLKGLRLGTPAELAAAATWTPLTLTF